MSPWVRRLACVGTLAVSVGAIADDTFFRDHVVPVLQRRCLGCHNDSEPKGDFSVESADGALASGLIDPGDAQASRVMEVIIPVDGEAEMPKDADAMPKSEIATIREWIERGAVWPSEVRLAAAAVEDFDWWSLRPLRRPNVPEVPAEASVRNPIDRFIQAKLMEHDLQPAPVADRHTLIRRLYFDLLGLPPTPEQVRAFVDDTSPDAYENLVDELLQSKHYGERWARHWLDIAHYADTHGYDKDKLRPNAWPYRDYVIRAFNEDKPYSRFIREQLAGDVLWPHSKDAITATGFIAAGPWDFIGHAEVPETKIDGRIARHLDRDDMVASTMNTFLSTTVQCARCHNHKFDPITQEHYYSLQTIFAALDRADRPYDENPETSRERASLLSRQELLEDELSQIAKKIASLGGDALAQMERQIAELEKNAADGKSSPMFGYHSQLAENQDDPKWFQVDLGETRSIQRIEWIAAHDNYAGIGAGFGYPVRFQLEVSDDASFASTENASTENAATENAAGSGLAKTHAPGVVRVVDKTAADVVNPGTTPQVFQAETPVRGRYVRMTASKLFLREDAYIFALGEMRVFDETGKNVALHQKVTALDSIEAPPRWQRSNVVDGQFFGSPTDETAKTLEAWKRERAQLLREAIPGGLLARRDELQQALKQVHAAIAALPKPEMVYAGTIHDGSGAFQGTGAQGGKPRTIHVLHRGNILQPGEEAHPGRIPVHSQDAWRFDLPADHPEGERRIALAQWIADEQNPLTWRSIVNRVWQYHFGRGIVDSPNDFGRMGAEPTHPGLLDWLAVEFRDGGQSFKKLHKLIVTSAAYQRAAVHDASNQAIDSDNKYLWRMNRRRLSAEEVRDAVLQVSGSLNPQMYGPGMQLFVISRPEHSPHYEYHQHDPNDPASHRRTIYRFIVRSQPDPFMTTLDCADSSQSVAKRTETVTPLQALSLFNNKFMLSMALRFAEDIQTRQSQLSRQVNIAFERAVGHAPTPSQQQALLVYAREHGLANTCRLLFNLNEFVFVD